VEQAVPLIFSRESLPPAPGWLARGLAAVVSLACLTFLIIGARLTPAAGGTGTHEQLGMPPCAFLDRTNLPCPACGFTTSVSHFAHGNVAASLYLQPMGFVIALSFCATVWVAGYVAVTGRPVYRLLGRLPARGILIALLTVAVGAWAWKTFLHLSRRDHWPP
jgi:hypothetical protein